MVRDSCREGAAAIVGAYGVPVIQSTFGSQLSPRQATVSLGGAVITDGRASIVQQAPFDSEAHLLVEA